MTDRLRDTDPAVATRWDALMAGLDGSERVRLATEMFATARALVEARVRADGGEMSDGELRARVFERLYASGLDEETRRRIAERLRRGL